MGTITAQLPRPRRSGAPSSCTGAEVDRGPDGRRADDRPLADGRRSRARQVFANVAPAVLARLLATPPPAPPPEGAQVKVNMLLSRLPRLRDRRVAPGAGVRRHVPRQRGLRASSPAPTGRRRPATIPDLAPCEIYCHSLTDPSILGPDLQAAGAQTLTLFALHMPTRLFRDDPRGALAAAAGVDPALARQRARRADRGLPARPGVHRGDGPARDRGPPRHARRPHLPPRPAVAVRRAPGRRRPLGRRDGPRQRVRLRRRRPSRRRRVGDPRPQRGDGGLACASP